MKLKDFYKTVNKILEDLCVKNGTLPLNEFMDEAANTLNNYYSKNFPYLKAIRGDVSRELATIIDFKNKHYESEIRVCFALIYDNSPYCFEFYENFDFDFDLFLTYLFFPELNDRYYEVFVWDNKEHTEFDDSVFCEPGFDYQHFKKYLIGMRNLDKNIDFSILIKEYKESLEKTYDAILDMVEKKLLKYREEIDKEPSIFSRKFAETYEKHNQLIYRYQELTKYTDKKVNQILQEKKKGR